jgi:polar amino acid transport system substrate-binding protein
MNCGNTSAGEYLRPSESQIHVYNDFHAAGLYNQGKLAAFRKPCGILHCLQNIFAFKPGIIHKKLVNSFAGAELGKYDSNGCSGSADTRLAAHNFTKPYIGNAQCMVLTKNTKVTAKSPEELTGYGVAYQAETTSDIFMTKLADGGLRFTPYEYEKMTSCFDELKLGRVDAIVCDSTVALDFLSPTEPYEVVWQGPADEVFGICMKKGNDALTQAIDKALDELFADGTMLRISNETIHMDMVTAARK